MASLENIVRLWRMQNLSFSMHPITMSRTQSSSMMTERGIFSKANPECNGSVRWFPSSLARQIPYLENDDIPGLAMDIS